MVSRKYTSDYRIEPYLDRNGKLRDRAVYCGAWYRMTEPAAVVKTRMIRMALMNLLATVTVLLPMCFNCQFFRTAYLILPQALLLLPIYFLWAGLLRVKTAGEKVTREHCDKIGKRIFTASLVLLILSVGSVAGTVVYLVLGEPAGYDWLAAAAGLVRLVPAILCFLWRRDFPMEELPILPVKQEN